MHPASVQVENPMRDRQAEPASRCLRPGCAMEAAPDVRPLFGGNAGARVSDPNEGLVVSRQNLDSDPRGRRAVPTSIASVGTEPYTALTTWRVKSGPHQGGEHGANALGSEDPEERADDGAHDQACRCDGVRAAVARATGHDLLVWNWNGRSRCPRSRRTTYRRLGGGRSSSTGGPGAGCKKYP